MKVHAVVRASFLIHACRFKHLHRVIRKPYYYFVIYYLETQVIFFLNPCRFLWLPYGDFLPLYNSNACCNFFSFLTVKPQPNKDKLLKELEKLKFLNGPSTVYNESRFVYLKQCGLYVEEYNVSKVRRGM